MRNVKWSARHDADAPFLALVQEPSSLATVDFEGFALPDSSSAGRYGQFTRHFGMDWRNFFALRPSGSSGSGGYPVGVVSGTNVGFNGYGQAGSVADTTDFDFHSVYMAAAFVDNLKVTVSGYDDGALVYSTTVRLSTSSAKFFEFDFDSIDRLVFDAGNLGNSHFTMDDMVFGLVPGTIAGTINNDLDGDGVLDEGETGIKGRIVILDDNGNGIVDAGEVTAETDRNGRYRFVDVLPGEHTVTQVLPAYWAQTGTSGPATVDVDNDRTSRADFLAADVRATTGSVSGTVFHDENRDGARTGPEPRLSGWTVWLDADGDGVRDSGERSTVTDDRGNYAFTAVTPGDVTVRVELPGGWERWAATPEPLTVVAGGTTEDVDFAVIGGATRFADRIVTVTFADDVIDALGGDDRVIAHAGDDIVRGGDGDDRLSGGGGDDALFGNAGDDRLKGKSGADLFGFEDAGGTDHVRDFAASEGDRILIGAAAADAFSDLTIVDRDGRAAISWAGSGLVVLDGVDAATLTASNFVFAPPAAPTPELLAI
jgi:Ca2+-binding RTX toxin-like protein